jgi:ATP-binding cassette subfamily C protein CydD
MNLDRRLFKAALAGKALLILAVLAGFLVGLGTVWQARLISRVIDGVFLGKMALADGMPLLWGLLAAIIARAGLTYLGQSAAGALAVKIKTTLRERLAAHLLALGPTYAWGERSGELINTATQGIEMLDGYFSQYLPQLALAALLPLAYLVIVLPIDPLSGLVLLLTGPLIPFFMFLIGKNAEALTRRQWTALGRMSAYFLDTLQGLATLKALGRSQEQGERIARVSERYRETTMSVLRVTFLSALALELLGTIGTAIVAVQIGLRLLYGRVDFAEAFFLLLLAPDFYLPLRTLGLRFHASMSGVTAAKRIYEILEQPSSPGPFPQKQGKGGLPRQDAPVTEEQGKGGLPRQDAPVIEEQGKGGLPRQDAPVTEEQGKGLLPLQSSPFPAFWGKGAGEMRAELRIELDNISYTYPGRERPALDEVSFDLSSGEMVALVGPSGAGKSTIARLLLRLIEPQRGQIFANGVPLADIPVEEWRNQLAWVPQSPYLFHGTLAENLRLARPGASEADLRRATDLAYLSEFIDRLALGFETPIGEGGARLSGGQAQRLALARAFLRDAPLLVLDEPTAHLDVAQEQALQDSLSRLCTGRAVLVIAHRLPTVTKAARILVLQDGKIVESGQHAALASREGPYARLISAYKGSAL